MNDIKLQFIQFGNPTLNVYLERFNRTARYELLDLYLFDTIQYAQDLATKWLWTYNNERSHKANGGFPPKMVLGAA